jgi:hypothetical protein
MRSEKETVMKFQKTIRVSMMLAGLGAVVLMAKPVYAQQEVDPDHFETISDSSSQDQGTAQASPSYEVAPAMTADSEAPLAAQEEEVAAEWNPLDSAVTVMLVVGIGSILLYGIAESVRGSRPRTSRPRTATGFRVGATAH